MNSQSFVLDFQWTQIKHDEQYHKDIVLLPLGARVKHMALHMAKYVGYLVVNEEADDPKILERIIVDAFIITLATANTLNHDLHSEFGGSDADNIRQLGLAFAASILPSGSATTTELLRPFARHVGALAKACESLDHLEAYPFRENLRANNIALFKLVVAAAATRDLDLAELYRTRLRAVEERSIFDCYFQRTNA